MSTKNYDNATDLITFSRASGGTALRKISYGSELGSDIAADWVATSGATVSQDGDWVLITATSAVGTGASLELPVTLGGVYQWSIEVDLLTATVADLQLSRITGGGGDAFSPSSYVYTDSGRTITYTGVCIDDTAPSYLTVLPRGAGLTARVRNISVKEVLFDQPDGTLTLFNHPTNVPRIEYAPDGTVKGLLVEEARTNLVTYSEDFTDASWATASQNLGVAPVVTADQTTSPDGNTNADRVFFETTGTSSVDRSRLRVASSTSLTGTGVFSVWIKEVSPGQPDLKIMIINGVGTTIVTPTAEWVRYSTPATAFTVYQPEIRLTGSDGTSSDVYLYGAQFEVGSFPTSYIPTSGSTATRAADIASIPVADFGYNQDAGTVVVEVDCFTTTGNNIVFELADGTSTSDRLYSTVDFDSVQWVVAYSNLVQASLPDGAVATNTFFKTASRFADNDFAHVFSDGGAVKVDTSGSWPKVIDTLKMGHQVSGTQQLNGHIKSIQYYPRRLTNTQLQELTS